MITLNGVVVSRDDSDVVTNLIVKDDIRRVKNVSIKMSLPITESKLVKVLCKMYKVFPDDIIIPNHIKLSLPIKV